MRRRRRRPSSFNSCARNDNDPARLAAKEKVFSSSFLSTPHHKGDRPLLSEWRAYREEPRAKPIDYCWSRPFAICFDSGYIRAGRAANSSTNGFLPQRPKLPFQHLLASVFCWPNSTPTPKPTAVSPAWRIDHHPCVKIKKSTNRKLCSRTVWQKKCVKSNGENIQ